MKFTSEPSDLLPLLEMCLPNIRHALLEGIDYANDIQPEPSGRDRWYWAHSARFKARQTLVASSDGADKWDLVSNVPNSGIHVLLGGLHLVRVLRSSGGTTPAPGPNFKRRDAWQQTRLKFQMGDEPHELSPLDLILDWTTDNTDALTMHLGMPVGTWEHGTTPILAWRVSLPSTDDLKGLIFTGSDDSDVPVRLHVDGTELETM